MAHFPGRGWGGGEGKGVLGLIYAGYVLLASQSPYLIIVYSLYIYAGANIIMDPILVT